jgi:hypothetical protein
MDKQAFYFSHDSNARNDIKIMKLRRKHGMTGYGIYWCIIEILRETSDYRLSVQDIEDIAFQLGEASDTVSSVVNDFGLFHIEPTAFYSNRLNRNMQKFNSKKRAQSAGGKKAQLNKRIKPQQDEPFV